MLNLEGSLFLIHTDGSFCRAWMRPLSDSCECATSLAALPGTDSATVEYVGAGSAALAYKDGLERVFQRPILENSTCRSEPLCRNHGWAMRDTYPLGIVLVTAQNVIVLRPP